MAHQKRLILASLTVRVESLGRCRLNAALTRMLFPFSSSGDLAHIKHVRETTFREYCSKGYTLIKDEMHNGEKECEILQVLDFLLQISTKRLFGVIRNFVLPGLPLS